VIARALYACVAAPDYDSARLAMREVIETEPSFTLDYAQVIDEENFTDATESTVNARAIIAGWLNGIRLIDNMAMRSRVQK
jgi:pantoate--beta-alanine ligase